MVVNIPLKGGPIITSITKNGISIQKNNNIIGKLPSKSSFQNLFNGAFDNFNQINSKAGYNYENDPVFIDLYTFFKNEINIVNLIPIQNVTKTANNDQTTDYHISFSSD
jgi:hypothetical protein